MKIKETNKTAHISWSPANIYPCQLACGTAAQQLDASFSTTSCLELYDLDLSNINDEFNSKISIPTESRFNKLLWSNYLNDVIIGGCEDGSIYLYDYEKILKQNTVKQSPLINKLSKHTGVVGSLDINPFQSNLLASGAGSSEIFIWDLNSPNEPMTPGAKQPPLDDIQCVAWNRQVQHILASTCSGKCVVWDLRKNESIIKVSDSISKLKAKCVVWHPDVATQLCLSSEDDHSPFLQMWDLRFATSPVKIFSGHHRGILTFTWCPNDSNLLLSCGKDNTIYTWNPNTAETNGEIVHEIPSSQWCFDAAWCTRYPQLVATSSYESLVSVYSLMGGKHDLKPDTSNKIMDSFGVASSNAPPPVSQSVQTQIIPQLKYAPKWLKRPCGVSFGFGGKLVKFGVEAASTPPVPEHQQAPAKFQSQKIEILQVVTDQNLVQQSQTLESAIQAGQLIEYCNYKLQSSTANADKEIWKFILGSFEKDSRHKFVDLLGFNDDELKEKVQNLISSNEKKSVETTTVVTSKFNSQLSLDTPQLALNDSRLSGERTKQLCESTDSLSSSSISRSHSPLNLEFNNQADNLLCESLLLGHYELAIDLCMSENRFADAILISTFASKEILERTQQRYFKHNRTKFGKLLEGFLNQDWQKIVTNCNLNHWKEALAAILTYTDNEQLIYLCNLLGNRIENEQQQNKSDLVNACICYICSFNLDSLAKCWKKIKTDSNDANDNSEILQVRLFKDLKQRISPIQYVHGQNKSYKANMSSETLNRVLILYARLLAEQGCFLTALSYLKDTNDVSLQVMKDRLYNALGYTIAQQYGIAKPDSPFKIAQPVKSATHTPHQSPLHHGRVSFGSPKIAQPNISPALPQNTPNAFTYPYGQQAINQPQPPPQTSSQLHPQTQPLPTVPAYNPVAPQTTPFYTPTQHQPVGYANPAPPPPPPSVSAALQQPALVPQPPTVPSNVYTPQQQQPTTFQPTAAIAAQTNGAGQAKPVSYQDVRPATAWNDPPMVVPKVKAPVVPKEPAVDVYKLYQPTMPTYTPASYMPNQSTANNQQFHNPLANRTVTPVQGLYDPPASMHMQPPSNNGYPSSANQFMNGVNQMRVPTPTMPMTLPPVPQQQQQQQRNQAPTPVQEIIKPKSPIPNENIIIQITFDDLLRKCIEASNTPLIKRKLADVATKLESLYDKLRDKTLSDSVVQGLHTIIQYIQSHDYQSSLALHSQIVATSNFSEISAFMPGIKVLLQSCQQLNVTL